MPRTVQFMELRPGHQFNVYGAQFESGGMRFPWGEPPQMHVWYTRNATKESFKKMVSGMVLHESTLIADFAGITVSVYCDQKSSDTTPNLLGCLLTQTTECKGTCIIARERGRTPIDGQGIEICTIVYHLGEALKDPECFSDGELVDRCKFMQRGRAVQRLWETNTDRSSKMYSGTPALKSVCFNCNQDILKEQGSVKKCALCLTARYCSKECQTTHWREHHKHACKVPRRLLFCSACQKIEENMKRCLHCRTVCYCNRLCQRAHWRQHKQHCHMSQISQGEGEEGKGQEGETSD